MSASDRTESSAGLLSSAARTATAMNGRLRLWPAVVIVFLQAASVLIPAMIAPGSFPHFMAMVFGPILVKADPLQHHELGRFQAVQGKAWNHPVIAHDRRLVRNSEKSACFDLLAGLPEKR